MVTPDNSFEEFPVEETVQPVAARFERQAAVPAEPVFKRGTPG